VRAVSSEEVLCLWSPLSLSLFASLRVCLPLCPWWAIYRESKGIIVPWKYGNRLNQICLNLESSLTARLGSASAKLEIAGRLIFLICFDPFHIVGGFPLIFLLILGESRNCGNQLPNLISDLILIGFDQIWFDLIWRFNWSKVDHSRSIATLPALNSQRSWRQYLAKSEESSSAELDIVCGEATAHPSVQLRVASGGANSLCGVTFQQFRRNYKLASWRNFEWLQGEVG